MLGYTGIETDPEAVARFESLTEETGAALLYRENSFAVAIDERPLRTGEWIRSGTLTVNAAYVLAFEGYLFDVEARDGVERGEFLLSEYARKGIATFENRNGAYSFCLYDRGAQRTWIGTCSFGRRDLYYLREARGIVFASDLKKVSRLTRTRPSLEVSQLSNTFLCGAIYGGATLLKGVRRALPGAVLYVTPNSFHEEAPAPLPPTHEPVPLNENEATDELDCRLRVAVERLARITPNTAVLMSAGVDSSLAAAYVKSVTGDLQAITLSMPSPPDETAGAATIAQALGGRHHVCQVILRELDILSELDTFVRVMEEPIAFGLGLLMMTLAREARLIADAFFCGVSADALFGDAVPEADDHNPDSIFHYMYREIAPECAGRVIHLNGANPDAAVSDLRKRLVRDPERQGFRLPLLLHNGMMIRVAARMTRFHETEALFPYLDSGVVDLALRLPLNLRGRSKPLLRALVARHYSPELQQGRKVPFTAHPVKWLVDDGCLGPLLDLLSDQRTKERGVYDRRELEAMIEAYRNGTADKKWHLVLWQLTVFELFCRRFVDLGAETPAAVHTAAARERVAAEA